MGENILGIVDGVAPIHLFAGLLALPKLVVFGVEFWTVP